LQGRPTLNQSTENNQSMGAGSELFLKEDAR
jgi:hypothetical protein